MTTTATPTEQDKEIKASDLSDEDLRKLNVYLADKPQFVAARAEVRAVIQQRASAHLYDLQQWQAMKSAEVLKAAPKEAEEADEVPAEKKATIQDRPETINDIVGQTDLVNQIRTVVMGAKIRDSKVPHILLVGEAGTGKTALAEVVAHDVGVPMIQTTGMVLRKVDDIIGLLMGIKESTVLFIDEIHALSAAVSEAMYTAMEDGRVDIVGGSGTDVVAHTHQIPGLIVVGATTRAGLLTPPMRDRFGFKGTMAPYSDAELGEIVAAPWKRVGVAYDEGEPIEVAKRSWGVPRLALTLAARVLDVIAVAGSPERVKAGASASALAVFGITETGLDETDMKILTVLTTTFAGKAVGLENLSQHLGIDKVTLSDQYEPHLLRDQYIIRSKGGRLAGEKAYELMKATAA